MYDVIVIGGGASGMMSAISAAQRGLSVAILEKNKNLGQKLDITGGGRCNITNATYDNRALLSVYGDAEPFLYSSFSQFSVTDTFHFFESRGLPLVVQARNRVFPVTEKSTDVCNVMKREIQKLRIAVIVNSPVQKILHHDGHISGVRTKTGTYTAGSYILATGGMSHPETGSTGDGFSWLADLGHTVKSPTPTIVPLAVLDPWVHALAGVSLSFMKITFFVDGKKSFTKTGKILFTHFGLSGPLILNSATQVARLLEQGTITATIDTCPDTDMQKLENNILKIFDINKNKLFKNILSQIVPEGLVDTVMTLLPDVDFTVPVHSVSKIDRKKLVHILKALPMTISGLMGFDRAVVADGGVDLREIDMKTMRSKKLQNLFVTGDLLHVNRPSGGYSLQLCWTTGYVAGNNA